MYCRVMAGSTVIACMMAGQAFCNNIENKININNVEIIISNLSKEIEENDHRYGDFDWNASLHGEYLVWKAIRTSDDCQTKDFLETEKIGVIQLCSIEKEGSIGVRDYEGGQSLDFSYKSELGQPPRIRTERLNSPISDYNDIFTLFRPDEAIAISYKFCSGERTLSFYRNYSLRLSDASVVASTIDELAEEVCKGGKDG